MGGVFERENEGTWCVLGNDQYGPMTGSRDHSQNLTFLRRGSLQRRSRSFLNLVSRGSSFLSLRFSCQRHEKCLRKRDRERWVRALSLSLSRLVHETLGELGRASQRRRASLPTRSVGARAPATATAYSTFVHHSGFEQWTGVLFGETQKAASVKDEMRRLSRYSPRAPKDRHSRLRPRPARRERERERESRGISSLSLSTRLEREGVCAFPKEREREAVFRGRGESRERGPCGPLAFG